MSATSEHNARMVVAAWHNEIESPFFSEPARSMTPSAINRAVADAWATVAKAIDGQADALAALGVMAGHSTMRELRGMATQAAHRNQSAVIWADELQAAESPAREEGKQ